MPDPGLPGVIILIAAVAIAVFVVWFVDRRARRGRRKTGNLHGMAKDESLSYFRDYGESASGPGVQEEDRTSRWGEGEGKSR